MESWLGKGWRVETNRMRQALGRSLRSGGGWTKEVKMTYGKIRLIGRNQEGNVVYFTMRARQSFLAKYWRLA